MAALKTKGNFYRTRTAYSINRTVEPVVSKLLLDVQIDEEKEQKYLKSADTVLDRITDKLKKDNKDQNILLMITPASKHETHFKLHVIQRDNQTHLGMITITEDELSNLKASKAFQNYCIVFASRYVNLLQTEQVKSLLNCLNRICCSDSKNTVFSQDTSLDLIKSYTSSAGDCFKETAKKMIKLQDSFMQTEPDEMEYVAFSDIFTLIEIINCGLPPLPKDIKRFFFMAEKLNFSLVVRPELLWKATAFVDVKKDNVENLLVESYLPDSSYLGGIALTENDLLYYSDLYPKLLLNIHVIEDVFEITPLPKMFVKALKNVLGLMKLELLYDALGEFLFDWYKNFSYLKEIC